MKHIIEGLRNTESQFEAEKAEFLRKFETNPAQAFEWRTGPLLLAQARYEIALAVGITDHDGDALTDEQIADGIKQWVKRTTRQLDNMLRTESRSTSAMSNLNEDAKNQATLELYGAILDASGRV